MKKLPLEAKCYCFLNLVYFLVTFVALFFSVYNYTSLQRVYNQIYHNDGIPGPLNGSLRYMPTKRLNEKLTDNTKDNSSNDANESSKETSAINSEKYTNDLNNNFINIATENNTDNSKDDSNENLAQEIISLLKKNIKSDMAYRTLKLIKQLQEIEEMAASLASNLSVRNSTADSFVRTVQYAATNQMPHLLSKTFKTPPESMNLTWAGKTVIRTCPGRNYRPNWVLFLKSDKTAEQALRSCYANGGRWMNAAEWKNLSSILPEEGKFWGHMFNDSAYYEHMKEYLRCRKDKDENCEILEDLKYGVAFSQTPSLTGKFTYIYRNHNDDEDEVGLWFGDAEEKRASFCVITKTMARWGYDEDSIDFLKGSLKPGPEGLTFPMQQREAP